MCSNIFYSTLCYSKNQLVSVHWFLIIIHCYWSTDLWLNYNNNKALIFISALIKLPPNQLNHEALSSLLPSVKDRKQADSTVLRLFWQNMLLFITNPSTNTALMNENREVIKEEAPPSLHPHLAFNQSKLREWAAAPSFQRENKKSSAACQPTQWGRQQWLLSKTRTRESSGETTGDRQEAVS